MAAHREHTPGTPARSPALQRSPEPAQRVPEEWLRGEHLPPTERIDRLAGDRRLRDLLAAQKFTGPDWEVFAEELARYGIAVIGGWTRRGMIISKCSEKGYGGLPEPPDRAFDDPDAVADVAHETVAVALRHFRDDVLVRGRWDPARGASLKTYFIGQCIFRFPNVYRTWWKQETQARDLGTALVDDEVLRALDRRRAVTGEAVVLDRMHVARLLRAVSNPQARKALVYSAAGWPHAEIAEELGVTAKAVERIIANEKARLKSRGVA